MENLYCAELFPDVIDDVIGHDRKLKKVQPNTSFPEITIQKELDRYLSPVPRKNTKLNVALKNPPYFEPV